MKTIYNYSSDTKEFINKIEIDAKYGTNIPFTTEIKPLKPKEGFAVVFKDNDWIYEVDNRGKVAYSKETKEPSTVDYLGKLKDGYTFEEPKQFDKWDDVLDKWVEDTEEKEQFELKQKLAEADTYLRSTDYYYARFSEIDEPVPQDVVDKRIEARDFIRANESKVK